ncbi:MAG: hypothetical protein PHW41_10660 [Eubacteriales bacterium]|nr:hypothetical protein [Eubacteriales bacterium]
MPNEEEVYLYTITYMSGASCSFISYGATWRSMMVPNRANELVDVVLGFDTLEEYLSLEWYIGATILPAGKIASVAKTPLDFRAFKPIGRDIDADSEGMRAAQGYDHNFVLRNSGKGVARVAEAYDPVGGVAMDILTDQPGSRLSISAA